MRDIHVSGNDLSAYELAMIAVVMDRTVHSKIDCGDGLNIFSVSPEEAAKLLTSPDAAAELSRLRNRRVVLDEERRIVNEKITRWEAIFSGKQCAMKKR